jgi:hypothetical protein
MIAQIEQFVDVALQSKCSNNSTSFVWLDPLCSSNDWHHVAHAKYSIQLIFDSRLAQFVQIEGHATMEQFELNDVAGCVQSIQTISFTWHRLEPPYS